MEVIITRTHKLHPNRLSGHPLQATQVAAQCRCKSELGSRKSNRQQLCVTPIQTRANMSNERDELTLFENNTYQLKINCRAECSAHCNGSQARHSLRPKVNCRFKNKLLYFNTKQLNLFHNLNSIKFAPFHENRQLSYVGTIYLMLMYASSPPCFSISSSVSVINSPMLS